MDNDGKNYLALAAKHLFLQNETTPNDVVSEPSSPIDSVETTPVTSSVSLTSQIGRAERSNALGSTVRWHPYLRTMQRAQQAALASQGAVQNNTTLPSSLPGNQNAADQAIEAGAPSSSTLQPLIASQVEDDSMEIDQNTSQNDQTTVIGIPNQMPERFVLSTRDPNERLEVNAVQPMLREEEPLDYIHISPNANWNFPFGATASTRPLIRSLSEVRFPARNCAHFFHNGLTRAPDPELVAQNPNSIFLGLNSNMINWSSSTSSTISLEDLLNANRYLQINADVDNDLPGTNGYVFNDPAFPYINSWLTQINRSDFTYTNLRNTLLYFFTLDFFVRVYPEKPFSQLFSQVLDYITRVTGRVITPT